LLKAAYYFIFLCWGSLSTAIVLKEHSGSGQHNGSGQGIISPMHFAINLPVSLYDQLTALLHYSVLAI